MNIVPLRALHDNYVWLIDSADGVVCVDPGAAEPVLDYLHHHRRRLDAIWLTHHHADHIGGVAALRQQFGACRIYGTATVDGVSDAVGEGDIITAPTGRATVWATPGHTRDHLAFILRDETGRQHVFCGDTLFSAGCGRVFDGTVAQLQQALAAFDCLPRDTLFYPAHEYTAVNLRFAIKIEPENSAMTLALANAQHHPTLPVSLAHERAVNPFLRFKLPHLRYRIAHMWQVDENDDAALFAALRQWKNEG